LTEIADHSLAVRWRQLDKSQIVKWTVYVLLLFNWAYYAVDEYEMAAHTLRQGGDFLQWTQAFATTIDEFGWFGLLFMFELETYLLDESMKKPLVKWSVHGLRLICYVGLLHTVYARVTAMEDVFDVQQAAGITSLCQVADRDISFGANYHYEIVTAANCAEISTDSAFYVLDPSVITDRDGLALEKKHVWVDFEDAVMWLLVVWAIELAVWLQNRNITGGPLMVVSHSAKIGYAVLLTHAAWWAWNGHWLYAWDQVLWIAGFWAIEMNLSDWREQIGSSLGLGKRAPGPASPSA
jgi:hypothetical protein